MSMSAIACGSVSASSTEDAGSDGGVHDGNVGDGALPGYGIFHPIHLASEMLIPGAPSVMLDADLPTIDTTALTINGQTSAFFVKQGSYAVLYVDTFSVSHDLMITGTLPLIVVARDQIIIAATIDLGGKTTTPGPGAAISGIGVGLPGATAVVNDAHISSGGGGGNYGSFGGEGGTSNTDRIPAGGTGQRYGMLPGDPLIGGAPGGPGGHAQLDSGGAGGGALQLSSMVSISITGNITSGGGGGQGGGYSFDGGGGGGAGGEIFLEAPAIAISSMLSANGGGGGGGGADGETGTPGRDGSSATAGSQPAAGGIAGYPMGAVGGDGAAGSSTNFLEASVGGQGSHSSGGGGGSVGRIWLRYRASTPPVISSARISPTAGLDPTLP